MIDANERKLEPVIDQWIAAHREELIRDVISLVNIRSTRNEPTPESPFGQDVKNAMDQVLKVAEHYGLHTENDGYYTVSALRPGETGRELAILGHIDTVPEGDGWKFSPFDAVVREGHIIGRGSLDNKGPGLAGLYVLRMCRELGIPFRHTLRMIFGGNEESGMADVRHYITTHVLPDFTIVCDGGWALCQGEKGIITVDLEADVRNSNLRDFHAGVASNSVPDFAYAVISGDGKALREKLAAFPDYTLESHPEGICVSVRGKAGHAAFPDNTVNAVYKLARLLTDARLLEGSAAEAVTYLADLLADHTGTRLGITYRDGLLGETTHICGHVRLYAGQLQAKLDIRYADRRNPEKTAADVSAAIAGAKSGFVIKKITNDPPYYHSVEEPGIRILLDTCHDYVSPAAKPYVMGGITHARHLKNAVPFGPCEAPDEISTVRFGYAHAPDEAVRIDQLTTAIKVYFMALYRLDREEIGNACDS